MNRVADRHLGSRPPDVCLYELIQNLRRNTQNNLIDSLPVRLVGHHQTGKRLSPSNRLVRERTAGNFIIGYNLRLLREKPKARSDDPLAVFVGLYFPSLETVVKPVHGMHRSIIAAIRRG